MKRRSFLQLVFGVLAVGGEPKLEQKQKAYPTQAQLKKIRKDALTNKKHLSKISFFMDAPDFDKVVGTREQIEKGHFAEPFRKAIESRPELIKIIFQANDFARAAYLIAKMYLDGEL